MSWISGARNPRLGFAKALVAATSSHAETVAVTLTATIANTYFQILSLKERIVQAQRIVAMRAASCR